MFPTQQIITEPEPIVLSSNSGFKLEKLKEDLSAKVEKLLK